MGDLVSLQDHVSECAWMRARATAAFVEQRTAEREQRRRDLERVQDQAERQSAARKAWLALFPEAEQGGST